MGFLPKPKKPTQPPNFFFKDFTAATVAWIRPVFLKDDETPKDVLANLQQNPDSQPRQDAAKNALAIELENNPQAEQFLKEMADAIQQKHPGAFNIDNRGAKIGQQNIGSRGTNTNPNFNN